MPKLRSERCESPVRAGALLRLGVPQTPVNKPEYRALADLGPGRLDEIEQFFVTYNLAQGRRFKPFGRLGPRQAEQLLDAAIAKYAQCASD